MKSSQLSLFLLALSGMAWASERAEVAALVKKYQQIRTNPEDNPSVPQYREIIAHLNNGDRVSYLHFLTGPATGTGHATYRLKIDETYESHSTAAPEWHKHLSRLHEEWYPEAPKNNHKNMQPDLEAQGK